MASLPQTTGDPNVGKNTWPVPRQPPPNAGTNTWPVPREPTPNVGANTWPVPRGPTPNQQQALGPESVDKRGMEMDQGRTYTGPAPREQTPNHQQVLGPESVDKRVMQMDQKNVASNGRGITGSKQMVNFEKGSAYVQQPGVNASMVVMNGETHPTKFTEQGADSLKKRNVVGKDDGAEFGSGKKLDGEEVPGEEMEGEKPPESKKKKWARRLGKLTACCGCKIACTACVCACIHTYPCHGPCCCGI